MDTDPRRFLTRWIISCLVFATIIVIFNVAIDPYLLFGAPRIQSINARKPTTNHERLVKAYDVLRSDTRTVLLGSSRVDLGMDATDAAWPANTQPVYNLGLGGAGPYTAYRYLQHVVSRQHVGLVVVGLDFEDFLTATGTGRQDEDQGFEAYLAVNRDGHVNGSWQHIRDHAQAAVSFDALTDSVTTLVANIGGYSLDFGAGGTWHWDSSEARGSYGVAAEWTDLIWIRFFSGPEKRSQTVWQDLVAILDLCRSRGVPVILFINPVHADVLEIIGLTGYWQVFEEWKRALVTLTAKYSRENGINDIPLWDFSGYDSYSTETVGHDLRWFYDSVHYNSRLGSKIVRRIFGSGDESFGVLLGPENIETHLVASREQQRLYRQQHRADAQRLRNLYNLVVGVQPQPLAGLHRMTTTAITTADHRR